LDQDYWIKLIMAAVCGTMIGFERQLGGKPIGIRTSILICLATMTFIDLSQMLTQDIGSARVLGQIVTGVGFLGAGVIMAREGMIIGVTSASVIWILAAVGSAIGLNRYGTALATSLITVCILVGVQRLENAVGALRKGFHQRPIHDENLTSKKEED
jgi:putative Mg2+ transporter-C (MgtC) family protein